MEQFIQQYLQFSRRLFLEKRLFVVIGALSGAVGLMMFFSETLAIIVSTQFGFYPQQTGLLLLLVATASFTLLYLQSGGVKRSDDSEALLRDIQRQFEASTSRVSVLEKEVALSKATLETIRPSIDFTAEERRAAIQAVVSQAGEEAIKSIFEASVRSLQEDLGKSLNLERFGSTSSHIIDRLRREITDLRLRSNVNLIIGMSITAGGLYLLWSTVAMVDASELLKTLASEGNESNAKFLKNLLLPIIPRVLLVIFVEVFAYFFLRLYKNGLAEIKYFQNELTNVESKLVAVEFSFAAQSHESLKTSLDALARTERNFILEKGQTTVELERAKSESELTRNVIKVIPEMFRKSKDK